MVVPSPNAPRPDDPLIRDVSDTLFRIARNYDREGSGPGSRFEGRLLEDVQAECVVREVRADERSRIAALLRSSPVLEFLARHGLRPGAGTARVLCAIAAEIEGPGAPGCEQHPERPKEENGG